VAELGLRIALPLGQWIGCGPQDSEGINWQTRSDRSDHKDESLSLFQREKPFHRKKILGFWQQAVTWKNPST
jgi:hypothetical protein